VTEHRRDRVTRAMLWTTASALPFLATGKLHPEHEGLALLSTSLVGLGALTLTRSQTFGRVVASLGLALAAILWTVARVDRPGWVFFALLGLSVVSAQVWPPRPIPGRAIRRGEPLHPVPEAMASTLVSIAVWFLVVIGHTVPGWQHRPELALVGLLPTLVSTPFATGVPLPRPGSAALLAVGALIPALALLSSFALHDPTALALAPLLGPVFALLAVRPVRDEETGGSIWLALIEHPPRLLVATFAAQCAIGGLLLALPLASTRGAGIPLIDALFTSVSATCVTGLNVLDPARDYSFAGQVIIALLIQVGGLGIMTFSAAALLLLSRRMSVRHETAAVDLVGAQNVAELMAAIHRVFRITFAAEGAGAVVLWAAFLWEGDPMGTALWHAVFTSVSAFCNAGFALRSDNLVRYADNPVVLHTVAALIIVGGLGPPVVAAITRWSASFRPPDDPMWPRRYAMNVHARIVIRMTIALLVVPAILIGLLEWDRSLAALGVADRMHNAWFQSVTLRTAGFNSIDLAHLQPATLSVMILCMFIGGSPGSTAGGAKTTTIAVLGLAARAAMRGNNVVEVFKRELPLEIVYRSGAITMLCVSLCVVATVILQVTQQMDFEVAMFEVVSAVGTVGLTIGGTPLLDDFGKLVIMACMFAGRVGPLTLFLLFDDDLRPQRVQLPSESLPVG
jgi:trk system potassium uptake protein TrkH